MRILSTIGRVVAALGTGVGVVLGLVPDPQSPTGAHR